MKVLRDQRTQIEQNRITQDKLAAELKKARHDAFHWKRQLQVVLAKVDALALDNAKLKGQNLRNMYVLVEALVHNKNLLNIHILETVLEQLDGLDNTSVANIALDQIRSFLWILYNGIEDHVRMAIGDVSAIRKLILDLKNLMPARAEETDDFDDVMRMFGQIKIATSEVSSLLTCYKAGRRLVPALRRRKGLRFSDS